MSSTGGDRQLKHPQEAKDSDTLQGLVGAEPTDFNLAELARLRIRYRGFPGADTIQTQLETVLRQWQLTEEELFAKTREIHAKGGIYVGGSNKPEEEDWS